MDIFILSWEIFLKCWTLDSESLSDSDARTTFFSVFLCLCSTKFSNYINNGRGSTNAAYAYLELTLENIENLVLWRQTCICTLSIGELRSGGRNHGPKWVCEVFIIAPTFFSFCSTKLRYVFDAEQWADRLNVFYEPRNVAGCCHLHEKDKQVLSPDSNILSCTLKVICEFPSKAVLEINLDQQILFFTLLSRLNLSVTKAISCQTCSNILLIKIQSI